MGESERYQEYKNLKNKKKTFTLGSEGNALMGLFALNTICFLLLMTIQVVYYFYQQTPLQFQQEVLPWFEMPAGLIKFSERPWTILTFMFSDTGAGLMRIIGNMLWLWSFGYLFQQIVGNEKMFAVYLYGGLSGAVCFLAAHYLIPSLEAFRDTAGLIGANSSVLAIAVAVSTFEPNHRILTHLGRGIPVWVFLIFYLAIDFIGIAGDGPAVLIAHTGGAAAGFIFIYLLKRGKDGSTWMNRAWFNFIHLFDPNKKKQEENVRDKFFYNTGERKPFEKQSDKQERLDEILDKINRVGYENLSEEDKDFLKNAAAEE